MENVYFKGEKIDFEKELEQEIDQNLIIKDQ